MKRIFRKRYLPGGGRGPVGKRCQRRITPHYADLSTWAPASAGEVLVLIARAVLPVQTTPNGTTRFACVCPISARPRYGTPMSRDQRIII